MTIWLVTIGSSDVELQHQGQQDWRQQFQSLRTSNREHFSNTQGLGEQKEAQSGNINNRSVLMRILGDIYQDPSLIEEKALSNLDFPLLEQFIAKLEELQKEESEKVEDLKVFVLLTDQSTLFSPDEMRKSECPYWQDTVQLKPVLKWYLKHKLGSSVKPQFLILKPHLESTGEESRPKGIDCWDAMLKEVRDKLNHDFQDIKVQANEKVYVSHQAGTPAISSALQFCSIAKFGDRVQFLVLNREYKNKKLISTAQLLESSEYIRAIQIEKAKQLIKQGEPGAALELIKKFIPEEIKDVLTEIVGLFNIQFVIANKEINENISDERKELNFKHATKRIYDALGVVDILFSNQKYIVGATILAAAHETFLKAAIDKQLPDYELKEFVIETFTNDDNPNKSKEHTVVPSKKVWDVRGLKVGKKNNKGEITHSLKSNHELLKILEQLPNKFEQWDMLTWIGTHLRGGDDDPRSDLRNQFMHNLRGATKEDVILYISGHNNSDDLMSIYQNEVFTPFHEALKKIGLWDAANLEGRPSIEDRLNKLIEDLDNLA